MEDMNISLTKGPAGPRYTFVRFHFSDHCAFRDLASSEGKLWAACVADVAKDPTWSFTLHGRNQRNEERRAMLIISWKSDKGSVYPAWTSTTRASTPPPQSPFIRLQPLLESPPQIRNVAFRPPLCHVILQPFVPPTDIITLYIPAQVDDEELEAFARQIISFQISFAHISHGPTNEMIWSNRGWGEEQVERGEKAGKMVMHVLLHTWKSKEVELSYKGREDGEYESMFLRPMRELEALGLEYEEEQVLLEPVIDEVARNEKCCCGLM